MNRHVLKNTRNRVFNAKMATQVLTSQRIAGVSLPHTGTTLPRIRPKTWDGGTISLLPTDRQGIPYGSGLHRAVLEGRSRQIRLLISFGANVNKRDVIGRTPAMLVASLDNDGVARVILRALLNADADINVTDSSGRSLLSHACIQGRTALVRRLLREDSVAANCPDVNGDCPLNLAAMRGFADIVSMLLPVLKQAGLSADTPNKQGCTAILLATRNGHYRCAEVLLEEGRASLSSRDNECFMNPAEWAHHSHRERGNEMKDRIRVVFGRGEAQQCMQRTDMLPKLGFAPRKFIPPFHSVAQELGNISLLRDDQTSLTRLIDSFRAKESEDSEMGPGAGGRPRPLSSIGTVDFDDIDTCLMDDPRMSTTPISTELPRIFNLYGQQLFIRKPQPPPENGAPEVTEEEAKKSRGSHLVRRQSSMSMVSPSGKKK